MAEILNSEEELAKIELPTGLGQVVLVLQGGGVLGAYQVGVYQALHEAGIEPDWVIGTSIGAINASIIAGNKPQDRLAKLQEFWKRVERRIGWPIIPAWTGVSDTWSRLTVGAANVCTSMMHYF